MNYLADAACARRGSGGCEGQRAEIAQERDEQQESGGVAVHAEPAVPEAYQLTDAEGNNAACSTITLVHEYVLHEPVAPPLVPAPSGFAVNLCPPPADADEQESPVTEEFRGLAFEGVADELENPPEQKQGQGVGPETMDEDTG